MKAYSQKNNSLKGQSFEVGVNEIFPIHRNKVDRSHGEIVQNPGY